MVFSPDSALQPEGHALCTLSGLTMIHEMMCRRGDVQDLVPQFLGEKSRIFITQCCLEELRKMGSEVSGVCHYQICCTSTNR